MLRKVVKSETYKPMRTAPGAFGIRDTLECGHVACVKGSQGFAKRRQCHTCDRLATGMVGATGNIRETWDAETQMPKRTVVESA